MTQRNAIHTRRMIGGDQISDAAAHLNDSVVQAQNDMQRQREIARGKTVMLSIERVYPDMAQPRRVLPYAVRNDWDGQIDTLPRMFSVWTALAGQEIGKEINLYDLVFTARPDDDEADAALDLDTDYPIYTALLHLTALAGNLLKEGQINAITVVRVDSDWHVIETGERRWYAFHLLRTLQPNEPRWETINARIMDRLNRWRQAGENNVRRDLNAIGRARQFALLLMEMLAEQGSSFVNFDQCASEQEYYAQVADGNVHRIPRDKSLALLQAMGLESASQLRHYRSLLRLDAELWTAADDQNWSERRLRALLSKQDTVTTVTVSPSQKPIASAVARRLNALIKANDRDGALRELDELERTVAEMRRKLQQ